MLWLAKAFATIFLSPQNDLHTRQRGFQGSLPPSLLSEPLPEMLPGTQGLHLTLPLASWALALPQNNFVSLRIWGAEGTTKVPKRRQNTRSKTSSYSCWISGLFSEQPCWLLKKFKILQHVSDGSQGERDTFNKCLLCPLITLAV